jgi:hypothetical protein
VFCFQKVSNNNLSGSLPTEIGFLTTVERLDLCEWAFINQAKKDYHTVRISHTFLVLLDSSRMTAYNALTGPIPSEIGNFIALEYLNLRKWAFINRLKKDYLPVPLSHAFLVLLDSSRMTDNNALTGPIPSAIGNLSVLQELTLSEWASINCVK